MIEIDAALAGIKLSYRHLLVQVAGHRPMIGGSMIGVQCEVGRLVQMANGLVRGFAWSEVSDLSVEELALGDEVLESIASDFDGHIDTISTEASNADFDIALVQLRVRQLTERANIHSCGNLSPN